MRGQGGLLLYRGQLPKSGVDRVRKSQRPSQLNRLSISELCFDVEDIDTFVKRLRGEGVEFLSKPQYFDLTTQSLGCSKAVYLKDPDGNILEFIETLEP